MALRRQSSLVRVAGAVDASASAPRLISEGWVCDPLFVIGRSLGLCFPFGFEKYILSWSTISHIHTQRSLSEGLAEAALLAHGISTTHTSRSVAWQHQR